MLYFSVFLFRELSIAIASLILLFRKCIQVTVFILILIGILSYGHHARWACSGRLEIKKMSNTDYRNRKFMA